MPLPLDGLKVLDFTTLLPGPYATQLLADMGADVLRVEAPNRVDMLKHFPPKVGNVSAAHATINRNKRCIGVDLKHPEAKALIVKLVQEYDVVMEQFRPGVMKKFGLDYESLKLSQNQLIYCSITGYGQTGPLKDRAGHDINYLALSGLASYSGRPETGPVLSGTQIADLAGGSHHAVMAVLAAVIQRSLKGEGQYLDISMSDAALALSTMFAANTLAGAKSPSYGSEVLNGGLFYGYYQTSDQRYLSIGSLEPVFASGMLSALGLSEWMPKIADTRPEVQQALRSALSDKFKSETFAHWREVFNKLDVCIEPVLHLQEAFEHPHFIARGMIGKAEDTKGNSHPQLNSALPFKIALPHASGKPLGADTNKVLEYFGYTGEEIVHLKKSGCIR